MYTAMFSSKNKHRRFVTLQYFFRLSAIFCHFSAMPFIAFIFHAILNGAGEWTNRQGRSNRDEENERVLKNSKTLDMNPNKVAFFVHILYFFFCLFLFCFVHSHSCSAKKKPFVNRDSYRASLQLSQGSNHLVAKKKICLSGNRRHWVNIHIINACI